MTTPESLLKLLDDFELNIFTAQSFHTTIKEKLEEWAP